VRHKQIVFPTKQFLYCYLLKQNNNNIMATQLSLIDSQLPYKNILLVDDDPIILKITKEVLCVLGHQVWVATDGCEALTHFHDCADTIDLVITDLDMPCMDGRTLVSILRASDPSLGIIVMTGNEKELEKPDSPIHAVTHWLAKPFFMNDLVAALDMVA
jgi:CheY-like chemotaxis protein